MKNKLWLKISLSIAVLGFIYSLTNLNLTEFLNDPFVGGGLGIMYIVSVTIQAFVVGLIIGSIAQLIANRSK